MEKVEITLSFDDEKLRALEFFLKKEKATVKGRLDEALAQLYEQTVPAPLREYLDSMAAPHPGPSVRRGQRRRKHHPRPPARHSRERMIPIMDNKEIVLWTDQRWYQALSAQLEEQGTTVEEQMKQHFESMLKQLPTEQYEQISQAIQAENQRVREEWEASRQFTAFHVREDGQEEYFQVESAMDILDAAHELRLYPRREDKPQTFAECFRSRQQITAEEFDQLTATHFDDPRRVTGVFELDFSKREFSAIDRQDGWRTFFFADVSLAAYHAYRPNGLSRQHRQARLEERLAGKELESTGHLCARQITFSDEIIEMDGKLNFYMDTNFDVDAMFGTNVCTAENNDWLNVYADYDMASGQVCDELEVDLHRADGREESVSYRLNAAEKAVLLNKMDAYCQEQTGMTLKDYSAQLMAEDMEPPVGPSI